MQTTVNERIKFLIDTYENGVSSRFAKRIGVSPSVVSAYMPDNERQGEPGFSVLQKIINAFPEVETDWLLKGIGPIVKEGGVIPIGGRGNNQGNNTGTSSVNIGGHNAQQDNLVIAMLQEQIKDLKADLTKKENELIKCDEERKQLLNTVLKGK